MGPFDNAMLSLSIDREVPLRTDGATVHPDIRSGLDPLRLGAGPVFVTMLPTPQTDLLPCAGAIRSREAGLLVLPRSPDGDVTHVVLDDPDAALGTTGLAVGVDPAVLHEIAQRLADPTRPSRRLLDAVTLARALAPGTHRAMEATGALALWELPRFLLAPGAADPDRPHAHYAHTADIIHRAAARTLLTLAGADPARLERRDGGVTVDRACGFMAAHIGEQLILDDVLRATDVSARGLQYAFQSRFRIGPMQWLREQRLRRLHAMLSTAPRRCGVTELATAIGFTHLGRLGGEFRRRFGLRPHEVLARAQRG
jgi:AraC-like DNA-binding protein